MKLAKVCDVESEDINTLFAELLTTDEDLLPNPKTTGVETGVETCHCLTSATIFLIRQMNRLWNSTKIISITDIVCFCFVCSPLSLASKPINS